jgi:hypothetical protein
MKAKGTNKRDSINGSEKGGKRTDTRKKDEESSPGPGGKNIRQEVLL